MTTRNRSTTPAPRSERQRLRLPRVLNVPVRVRFISFTASTASPFTSSEFGQVRGACSVEEKTTLGTAASPVSVAPSFSAKLELSDDASSDMLDISRYVFAPIRKV